MNCGIVCGLELQHSQIHDFFVANLFFFLNIFVYHSFWIPACQSNDLTACMDLKLASSNIFIKNIS